MRQVSDTSWYDIQPGNVGTAPSSASPLGLIGPGGLGACTGGRAGLRALLAGSLWVGVPRPIPVGAVAHRQLVDVHPLTSWDHPVPSKAIGT